jgi:hypothetical protein
MANLAGFHAQPVRILDDMIDWNVELDWLIALDTRHVQQDIRTVRRNGQWFIVPTTLRPTQTPVRLQHEA